MRIIPTIEIKFTWGGEIETFFVELPPKVKIVYPDIIHNIRKFFSLAQK